MTQDNLPTGQDGWLELFDSDLIGQDEPEEINENNIHQFLNPVDFENENEVVVTDNPDEEITASLRAYQEFVESDVWEDMKKVLNERIGDCLQEMRRLTNSTERDLELKCRMDECEMLLDFPEKTIKILQRREQKLHNLKFGGQ